MFTANLEDDLWRRILDVMAVVVEWTQTAFTVSETTSLSSTQPTASDSDVDNVIECFPQVF